MIAANERQTDTDSIPQGVPLVLVSRSSYTKLGPTTLSSANCCRQSVGAPAPPRRPSVYLEPRDQPAPDPARCFDCPVDPAPAAQ
eukprot:scaffold16661_cov53-Phaeocystis_antarctica.AAC.3